MPWSCFHCRGGKKMSWRLALSCSSHYSSLAIKWSSWCPPLPLPSLPRRQEEKVGRITAGTGREVSGLRHMVKTPVKAKTSPGKDGAQDLRGTEGKQWATGSTAHAHPHASVPAPKPWGNTFILQRLTQVAAFACLGKWSNFVLY